jgi:dTDP-4-dehydrorhamnose reductase
VFASTIFETEPSNFLLKYLKTGGNEMDLPYIWDFIQNNIQSEKLAKLRRRFMEEWRSGR